MNSELEVEPSGSAAVDELVAALEELAACELLVVLLSREVAAWKAALPTFDWPMVDCTVPLAVLDELDAELLAPPALDCTTLFMFCPLENSFGSR